jgi:uncharacterized spore protein YtfJ
VQSPSDVIPSRLSAEAQVSPGEIAESSRRQAEFAERMTGKIFAATLPGAVFSQPVVSGSVTIITASEISSGGGFGFGSGFGRAESKPGQSAQSSAEGAGANVPSAGGGSGMGGGGGAMARPVAAVIIGPDGVKIQPIYDVTKVALAGLAALGTIVAIWSRSRRGRRG